MPRDRDPETWVDMAMACRRIGRLIAGFNREQFMDDERTQGAVIHQVLILGEAAKRLSPPFREAHRDIPWSTLARTRDLLIHQYHMVDLNEVWMIAERDIPVLLSQIEVITP